MIRMITFFQIHTSELLSAVLAQYSPPSIQQSNFGREQNLMPLSYSMATSINYAYFCNFLWTYVISSLQLKFLPIIWIKGEIHTIL